jgi:hypothetical protein
MLKIRSTAQITQRIIPCPRCGAVLVQAGKYCAGCQSIIHQEAERKKVESKIADQNKGSETPA